MNRNERETAVLAAVIEEYINTGEPVSSALVTQKSRLGLSPASIRSVMVTLTENGYLAQPHVSSGRVPTAKAFRLYVDAVLAPRPLSAAKKHAITQALDVENPDISQILRKASGIVSAQCLQLGVVLAPRRAQMRWRAIEFSQVNANLILAVLILDGGLVRNRMVAVTTEYSSDELIRYGNYLNENFKGCTLSDARDKIEAELALAGEELEEMCRNALSLFRGPRWKKTAANAKFSWTARPRFRILPRSRMRRGFASCCRLWKKNRNCSIFLNVP
ncbi:MAG: Heat-inducible transcription repressor HrcA [Desulfovibrio sp.]